MFAVDARRLILSVCLGLSASCGSSSSATPTPSPPPAPTLKAIAFATTSLTISSVGQTAQLQVVGTYSDGSTKDITSSDEFTSSRIDVATATSTGLVTAWEPGTTTFSALEKASGALGVVATATVTVANGPPSDPTLVPALLSPDDNAAVPASPTGILTFNWSSVPGATAYHLSVDHAAAQFPTLDKADIPSPPWQIATNVVANNFNGWRWSVQAKVNGVFQAWSVVRVFNFVSAPVDQVDARSRAPFGSIAPTFVPPTQSRR
jgi:hypothetical protein